ncbi:MAG: hypothetical protein M3177_03905 [Pseudomonadota bacterium]|nr:hypothetical protein [Pseudomonadota bacterium]
MRGILGILAGIVAAILAIMAVGWIGGLFFSVDAPTDPMQNPEATASAIGGAPLGAQIVLILSWFAGGLAGAAAAKRVARASWPGWVVAGGLALLLASTFLIPLPVWMQVMAVLAPLAGALLADLLMRREGKRTSADARA